MMDDDNIREDRALADKTPEDKTPEDRTRVNSELDLRLSSLKSTGVTDATLAPVTHPHIGTESFTKHPHTSERDRRMGLAILLCGTFCFGLGQTVLFTILPPIARQVGLHDLSVGIIFTISAVLWVFMSPFWGRRSDRVGRKPILMIGIGVFAFSILGLALTLQTVLAGGISVTVIFLVLIGFRALHGGFSSAGPAAAQAYLADRSSREDRAASLASLAASFGLGATLGPGLASATLGYGPVAALYLVSGCAVLAFFAIWKYLPERSMPKVRTDQPGLKMLDKRLQKPLVYGVFGGILMVVPIQLFGFYLIDRLALDLKTASQYLGIAFMMSSMAALISQLVIIQHFKISTSLLLKLAPALIFMSHMLIVFGHDIGTLVFALALGGLGAGLYTPSYNARMSLSVQAHEQGAVAGIANSAYVTGYVVTPILAFSLYGLSPQLPFLCTGLIALGLTFYAHIFL